MTVSFGFSFVETCESNNDDLIEEILEIVFSEIVILF